mmetsp:Transcript_19365/g.39820  ORF Transcript_19365/g.39820 Transcript_19365/m.39820 type:complete len:448 (+) Transcript_19365:272-1615(+)
MAEQKSSTFEALSNKPKNDSKNRGVSRRKWSPCQARLRMRTKIEGDKVKLHQSLGSLSISDHDSDNRSSSLSSHSSRKSSLSTRSTNWWDNSEVSFSSDEEEEEKDDDDEEDDYLKRALNSMDKSEPIVSVPVRRGKRGDHSKMASSSSSSSPAASSSKEKKEKKEKKKKKKKESKSRSNSFDTTSAGDSKSKKKKKKEGQERKGQRETQLLRQSLRESTTHAHQGHAPGGHPRRDPAQALQDHRSEPPPQEKGRDGGRTHDGGDTRRKGNLLPLQEQVRPAVLHGMEDRGRSRQVEHHRKQRPDGGRKRSGLQRGTREEAQEGTEGRQEEEGRRGAGEGRPPPAHRQDPGQHHGGPEERGTQGGDGRRRAQHTGEKGRRGSRPEKDREDAEETGRRPGRRRAGLEGSPHRAAGPEKDAEKEGKEKERAEVHVGAAHAILLATAVAV